MGKNIRLIWNAPIPQIIRGTGVNAETARFAATEWHRLYHPFVPYREGYLANNVTISASHDKAVIRHIVPYARKMYYGASMRFNRESHRLASAYWDRAAAAAGRREKLIRAVQRYVKRRR